MSQKIELRVYHATGVLCVMSITRRGQGVRVSYSFRDDTGFPGEMVPKWVAEFSAWYRNFSTLRRGVVPPLPDGWAWEHNHDASKGLAHC